MSDQDQELRCPICGHGRATPLRRYRRAHLARCGRCGQVFAGRRPSDSELAENYSRYPRNDYDSAITRRRYRELLQGFAPYRCTNRVLDVGCGLGFFLEEAQAAGWEAYGSEFEARAVEINRAKGIACVQAPISADEFEPQTFDVITAFEVVEHLRDPAEEASLIAHLLRPGGLFYCTTPNFRSLSRLALRDRWAVIEYPEHLLYFTPATLRRWLARVGFRPVRTRTTGFSLARRWAAAPPGAPGGGELPQERLRASLERSRVLRAAKASANAALGAIRAGDTIKGHFVLDADPLPALSAQEHLEGQQRP